jgi:hypothetical protein
MNMIYESMRNKGGLVLVPASALETMNIGTVLGVSAYGKQAVQESGAVNPREEESNEEELKDND